MNELSDKIFALLEDVKNEDARVALAEVVSEFGLEVAANLIENDLNPFFFQKSHFEEFHYSEGNEDAGHFPLADLLDEVKKIINCDADGAGISIDDSFVRLYTSKELEEEGKENDGIVWWKHDDEKTTEGLLLGFCF
ncbi:hypothetical protein [Bacillus sp. Marseille-P3800]|uniref:hypothetical protein n=1 Tax=Bacillus sp. Marseille-P3800 TaxID=2014782 RepID=UPI000C08B7C7|nr:hypothetical protein [Bacillus sp. Marseille-P3800]